MGKEKRTMKGYPYRELTSESVRYIQEHMDGACEEYAAGEGFFGYRMDLAFRRCEIKLTETQTVEAMARLERLDVPPAPDWDRMWDTLTRAQHCGVNHHSREAQEEALAPIRAVMKEADDYLEKLGRVFAGEEGEGKWTVVINPYPIKRTMFTCIASKGPLYVYDGDERLPAQYIGGDGATAVALELEGYSMRCLRVEENAPPTVTEEIKDSYHFENDVMAVDVLPNGQITSLVSKKNGEKLPYGGNLLEAFLQTADGRDIHWSIEQAQATGRVEKGDLFDNVLVDGKLGDIPYSMIMYLPHGSSQRIEIMTDLYPTQEVLDCLKQPESRIQIGWKTGMKDARVLCDGPFNWRECGSEGVIRSANGLTVTKDGSGVMLDHQGMTRTIHEDGTLIHLLAQGGKSAMEDGPGGVLDARTPDDPCAKSYRFFNAIDLTDTDAPENMFGRIVFFQTPMFPLRAAKPVRERKWLCIEGDCFLPTALRWADDKAILTVWNASEQAAILRTKGEWQCEERELAPMEISDLVIKRL